MKAYHARLNIMKRIMKLYVSTKEHGITINLTGNWNGKVDQDYFLKLSEYQISIIQKIL
jgi:hypothetical protein